MLLLVVNKVGDIVMMIVYLMIMLQDAMIDEMVKIVCVDMFLLIEWLIGVCVLIGGVMVTNFDFL